jgi:hypothetical protein
MEVAILVAIISAAASIFGAALTFYFSRKKEREADWRKIKLEHYRDFMSALSSIVGSDATPEGHRHFAKACNTVQLVASKQVIMALHNFRDEIAGSNPKRSLERHDELLSKLMQEIRTDLGVSVESNTDDLTIRLWVSGVDNNRPS